MPRAIPFYNRALSAVPAVDDRCRHRLRRLPGPSQGRLRLLLHRNVGALLLLRHEGAAAAVPDQVPPVRRQGRPGPARRLRWPGLLHPGVRRHAGRPLAGHAPGGAVRRHPAGAGPPRHGIRGPRGVPGQWRSGTRYLGAGSDLPVAGADHHGRGLPQAEHLHHRRQAVRQGRPAPRFGFLAVLRRHQPGRAVLFAGVRLPRRGLRLEVRLRRGRYRHAGRPGDVPVGPEIPAGPRRTAAAGRAEAEGAGPATRMAHLSVRGARCAAGGVADVGRRQRCVRAGR